MKTRCRNKKMKRYSTLKTKTPLKARKPWNPKRSALKVRTVLKATKPMRKVGKVGRANSAARKKIASIAEKMEMKKCEIGLEGCLGAWPLAPAHRHKRAWYQGDAKLLADPRQWVCACQDCHDKIEFDGTLTEEIFLRLRGPAELKAEQ